MRSLTFPRPLRGPSRVVALLLAAALSLPAAATRHEYDVVYRVGFDPDAGTAQVTITVTPDKARVGEIEFDMPADLYSRLRGDGGIERDGDAVVWKPRADAPSTLRYDFLVNNRRRTGGYDARITDEWAIVRGDDLIPARGVRTTRNADSRARLRFDLPESWGNVDTPYLRAQDGRSFVVVNPQRRFDRPVGWIIAGDVGTRREDFGDLEVSVAGPKSGDVRRVDMLAFFNGLVPEFRAAFGDLPAKLLIVSAGDPMWRGGLSGPRSLFLHADRPLISENGTSTLTHELTHVITRIRGADGDDWIAEGLAEFYSIELLHRAGLLSDSRAERAHEWMRDHGENIGSLTSNRSKEERTARAVELFADLDREIRTRTKGRRNLDDVVRRLIPLREISREDLREHVEQVTGAPSTVLDTPLLD